jgi:hypothetical protein
MPNTSVSFEGGKKEERVKKGPLGLAVFGSSNQLGYRNGGTCRRNECQGSGFKAVDHSFNKFSN